MTYTITLTTRELEVLEELAAAKELTPTGLLRQALRVYQLVDNRLIRGDRIFQEPLTEAEQEIRAFMHPDS